MKNNKPQLFAAIAAFLALAIGIVLLFTNSPNTLNAQVADDANTGDSGVVANPVQAIPFVIASCDAYATARHTLLTGDPADAYPLLVSAHADAERAVGFDATYERLVNKLAPFADEANFTTVTGNTVAVAANNTTTSALLADIDGICESIIHRDLTGATAQTFACVYFAEWTFDEARRARGEEVISVGDGVGGDLITQAHNYAIAAESAENFSTNSLTPLSEDLWLLLMGVRSQSTEAITDATASLTEYCSTR